MRKIKKIQKRCLQIIVDGYKSNYDVLFDKSGKSTTEVRSLPTVAIEIFKTLNNQNPSFIREIFYRSLYVSHKKQNLFEQSHKAATFGNKSVQTYDPQIWNSLPEKISLVANLVEFRNSIKKLFCAKFMYNLCFFKNENAENRP